MEEQALELPWSKSRPPQGPQQNVCKAGARLLLLPRMQHLCCHGQLYTAPNSWRKARRREEGGGRRDGGGLRGPSLLLKGHIKSVRSAGGYASRLQFNVCIPDVHLPLVHLQILLQKLLQEVTRQAQFIFDVTLLIC